MRDAVCNVPSLEQVPIILQKTRQQAAFSWYSRHYPLSQLLGGGSFSQKAEPEENGAVVGEIQQKWLDFISGSPASVLLVYTAGVGRRNVAQVTQVRERAAVVVKVFHDGNGGDAPL